MRNILFFTRRFVPCTKSLDFGKVWFINMKKEVIQAFTARISQASRSELTVILYEMLLTEVEEAYEAYELKDFYNFDLVLKKAQKYVNELIVTLDYHYKVSYDLLSLYLYVNKMIITAHLKKDVIPLDPVKKVISKLVVGFEGVSKQDQSGPLMRNTQQLYAGLTYGKYKLNETYIDPSNINRGFKA